MNEHNDLMSQTATDWLRKTLSAPLYELDPERLYSHDKRCLTQHLIPPLIHVSGLRRTLQISRFASHWHAVLSLIVTTFLKGNQHARGQSALSGNCLHLADHLLSLGGNSNIDCVPVRTTVPRDMTTLRNDQLRITHKTSHCLPPTWHPTTSTIS